MAARWFCVLVIALCAFSSPAVANDWEYTLRPGESIWQVAVRYCGSKSAVQRLVQHNNVQRPEQLRAGTVLQIPVDCLVKQPVNATLVAADSSVQLERDGTRMGVKEGDTIRMGDTLFTADSFAVVEFADRSRLTIRPNSTVSFLLLAAHGESGMVDTLMRLRKGRVQHVVEGDGGKGHRHRIATPVGAAAVRGTRFRVELPTGDVATVATTEGEVGFLQSTGPTTAVPAGLGLVANEAGSRTEPLLPAPALGARRQASQLTTLRWDAVAEATGYRLTLSVDGRPVDESVVTAPEWLVDAPLGSYQLAVRAIAASGLEGLDATAALDIVHAAPEPQAATISHAGEPVRFQFVPASGDPGPFVVRVRTPDDHITEYPTPANEVAIALAPGRYDWQVVGSRGVEGAWSSIALKPAPPAGVSFSRPSSSRRSRADPIQVAPPLPEGDSGGYVYEIVKAGKVIRSGQLESGADLMITDVPACYPCQIRLANTTLGLQSDYTEVEYRDSPGHPWPIYVALALLALAL